MSVTGRLLSKSLDAPHLLCVTGAPGPCLGGCALRGAVVAGR